MAKEKLSDLVAERKSVADALVRIRDRVLFHGENPLDKGRLQKLFNDLEKYSNNLDGVYTRICIVVDSEEEALTQKREFFLLSEIADDIYTQLSKVKDELQENPNVQLFSNNPQGIQLPKLQLTTFTGDFQEWISFRDMFRASVHNKDGLSNVQKLSYLKSCVQGEAARLIQSISLSEANYTIAWQQLTERYDNDREIFLTIMNRLFNQPVSEVTACSLRSLIDVTSECLRSMDSLQLKQEPCSNALVFYLVLSKLDSSSRQLWEQGLKGKEILELKTLFDFIEQRSRALSIVPPEKIRASQTKHEQKRVHAHVTGKAGVCACCNKPHHQIFKCSKFHALSPTGRRDLVKKLSLCFNCLAEGHTANVCPKTGRCKTCSKAHHSLLHIEAKEESDTLSTVHGHHAKLHIPQGMLATAVIKVLDDNGTAHQCRALLDGGSSSSFITESCVNRLKLRKTRASANVVGLMAFKITNANSLVHFQFTPHFTQHVAKTCNALVLPKVTDALPANVSQRTLPHLVGLTLADPYFDRPANIDILFGADVFWDVIGGEKRTGQKGDPLAVSSVLGWIVAGCHEGGGTKVRVHFSELSLESQLEKFWNIESIHKDSHLTVEEQICEKHFQDTYKVDNTGRFTVAIPCKHPRPLIGDSRTMAVRRLYSLERRLAANPEHRKNYNEFMAEYRKLDHMSLVPDAEILQPKHEVSYIPHHFVQKHDSTTTKFRVVFDASAKTTSGNSLNDTMLIGPQRQDPLIDILTRFRIHKVAFCADIAKMYRQIRITPADADMHRIVWRESPSHPIQEFRLQTVTYGTASAPYLAIRVLQQLGVNYAAEFPMASYTVQNSFYVDDMMESTPNVKQALQLQTELLELMSRGCMSLRKWSSNSSSVLANLPESLLEKGLVPEINVDPAVKTLGIRWNTRNDKFHFKYIDDLCGSGMLTKRKVLSQMSKLFDPLGLISPVIIRAKIFMQTLWKSPSMWDDELPAETLETWERFKTDLQHINTISVPRCLMPSYSGNVSLVGFCDASEKAYGAVVYLRCVSGVNVTVNIVQSKTRVAPLKQISLPRLELCGAALLAELIISVKNALKLTIIDVFAWTDSTVVLGWLASHPSRWKSFIANRVSIIQDVLPISVWGHVQSKENPADLCSRGLSAESLAVNYLWWNGPDWLCSMKLPREQVEVSEDDTVLSEVKKTKLINCHSICDESIMARFSSYTKLIRVIAWILRFMKRAARMSKLTLVLSVAELSQAARLCVRVVQSTHFPDELRALRCGRELSTKSRLLCLNPFLDTDGLIRVGGRLSNSSLEYGQKYPVVLPHNSHFTMLLINYEHLRNLHAGPTVLQSVIMKKFWILRARAVIRKCVRACVTCAKSKATMLNQIMGNLPKSRVTECRAFKCCGIDFAGPFQSRPAIKRSKQTIKSYLCLIVCFSSRALHLEIVSSLSTDAFLAAFRRFASRRGSPSHVYSDCGTNFKGADRELQILVQDEMHNSAVSKSLASEGISWHFNPPGAPHFGGLWEAGVKSVKFHLNRIVGAQKLTYEELATVATQIEAILNSRPLTPVSDDPSDLNALTPGHFLIGEPLVAVPDQSLIELNPGRLSRWQLLQTMQQHFWQRWSREFLSRLQQRPKWLKHRMDLKVGDLVIIKDDNLPPQRWRLGRVTEVHPGNDGCVRVVSIKTADGNLKRPIHKLCLLPIVEPEDDVM